MFGRLRKRHEVINHFIRRRGYRRYLEIGTARGRNLKKVLCAEKVGVDPNPSGEVLDWLMHEQTSDAFFAENELVFDLVFIDGLHLAEQALSDLFHGLRVLSPGGLILLHDYNPSSESAQLRDPPRAGLEWNGDVWKAVAYIRAELPDLLFSRVIDIDHGLGVVATDNATASQALGAEELGRALAFVQGLAWEDLVAARGEILGLVPGVRRFERELQVWLNRGGSGGASGA